VVSHRTNVAIISIKTIYDEVSFFSILIKNKNSCCDYKVIDNLVYLKREGDSEGGEERLQNEDAAPPSNN
jgi:hypothetical protein